MDESKSKVIVGRQCRDRPTFKINSLQESDRKMDLASPIVVCARVRNHIHVYVYICAHARTHRAV